MEEVKEVEFFFLKFVFGPDNLYVENFKILLIQSRKQASRLRRAVIWNVGKEA